VLVLVLVLVSSFSLSRPLSLSLSLSPIAEAGNQELNLEPTLMDTLLPFQLEGIKYVINHGGKALIADEMGLGKTIQAIGVLQHYRQHWPALILAPVTLIQQWYQQIQIFSGSILSERDVCIVKKGSDKITGLVCIVPYTMLDKFVDNKKLSPEQVFY
jgi:SNF2 family DNA or RNA helicase